MSRNIWSGAIGQILLCQQEPGNIHDPYSGCVVWRRRPLPSFLISGCGECGDYLKQYSQFVTRFF